MQGMYQSRKKITLCAYDPVDESVRGARLFFARRSNRIPEEAGCLGCRLLDCQANRNIEPQNRGRESKTSCQNPGWLLLDEENVTHGVVITGKGYVGEEPIGGRAIVDIVRCGAAGPLHIHSTRPRSDASRRRKQNSENRKQKESKTGTANPGCVKRRKRRRQDPAVSQEKT